MTSRRRFVRHLATSPLVAAGLVPEVLDLGAAAQQTPSDSTEVGDLVSSVNDALNVFDFHAVVRDKLPPAHYGFMATGTDDDATLRANRDGFRQYQLRVRRLIDARHTDTASELLGARHAAPIALAPVGSQKMFNPQGEAAVARAAAKTSTLQILSNFTSTSVEDVVRERGGPVWFQLYAMNKWEINRAMLKRAERAGCPVVALTVDVQAGRNPETATRLARADSRNCSMCHERPTPPVDIRRKPLLRNLDLTDVGLDRGLTWEVVPRLREATSMKVFLKGIVTAEDAELCIKYGVDGLIVSNHGGRSEASERSTIECLPEIVETVQGRLPVLIDGGFRRGTDVFKALAIGADAVCVGRPYLWGLASFGQEGVEAVIKMLQAELALVMRQAGTTSIDRISREHVRG